MKRKEWVSWLFRVGLSLAVVLVLAIGVAYADREQPGPKPAGSGADKPNLASEKTEPNKIPYVGPQTKNNGPREDVGTPHLFTPSVLINEDPEGGKSGSAMAGVAWSKDIYASDLAWPPTNDRYRVSLATHANNNLYIAYMSNISGDPTKNTYIRVNYSADGGLTWKVKGQISFDSTVDLRDPSIAVTSDTIVVAYVVYPATGDPYVEIATCPLTGSTWTAHSILHQEDPVDYSIRPRIWTDANIYSASSSVYLVYEWYVGGSATNVNSTFQRSSDDGATWKDRKNVIGGASDDTFNTPSGCFGEGTYHMLYVTSYDTTSQTLYVARSSDWGVTWSAEQAVYTLTYAPNTGNYYVLPGIAAATTAGNQNAILVFSQGINSTDDDDICYLTSSNNGANWYGAYNVPGGLADGVQEVAPVVIASPKGSSFYVAFTEFTAPNTITCSRRSFVTGTWSGYTRVNYGGLPSISNPRLGLVASFNLDFPMVAWNDYGYDTSVNEWYSPRFNRLVPDDLVGTWAGDGTYFRSDINSWHKLGSPATQVTVGDLDDDDTADIAGVWPSQSGAWVYKSTDKAWVLLGSTPVDIECGDMDGNGSENFVATWDGQGVYYKTSISGSWVKMATPATMIAVGDLDGDDSDDIAGVWPGQGGVWVKYSATGTWTKLGSTAVHIATGDMNGDGNKDLLGTWDGQGVYYRNSVNGAWVKMATPATLIASGDLDGDGSDDLIGIWPAQAGVWVKYSGTGAWKYISSTAVDISAGKMRGGANTWGASAASLAGSAGLAGPLGGSYVDLSRTGPGGSDFVFRSQGNLMPMGAQAAAASSRPGPGEPGFACSEQENLVPRQVEDDAGTMRQRK